MPDARPSQEVSRNRGGTYFARALRHPQVFHHKRVYSFNPCFRIPVLECFLPGSSTVQVPVRTVLPIKVGFIPRGAFPIAPRHWPKVCSSCPSGWLGYPWLPSNFNLKMQGRCDPIPFSFALGACFCHFKMEVRKILGMVACHTGMRSHGLADRLTRPIFGSKSPERIPGVFGKDPLLVYGTEERE